MLANVIQPRPVFRTAGDGGWFRQRMLPTGPGNVELDGLLSGEIFPAFAGPGEETGHASCARRNTGIPRRRFSVKH